MKIVNYGDLKMFINKEYEYTEEIFGDNKFIGELIIEINNDHEFTDELEAFE